MKKNILPLVLALAVFSSSVPVFASDITVNVNSEKVVFEDQEPVIKDNRTLIPLRGVMEKMGAEVYYIDSIQTVSIEKGTTDVTLKIGDNVISINDEKKELDVAPVIINDRTMVPIRAIAEAFGAEVLWDENTKTVDINMPEEKTILDKSDVTYEAQEDNFSSKATENWMLKTENGTEVLKVTLVYPQLNDKSASSSGINSYISSYVHAMATKYIEENQEAMLKTLYDLGSDYRTNEIYISYEDLYHDDTNGILSYLTTFMVYTGGAHPVTYGYGMTLDLKTGKEINLSDLAGAEGKNNISDIQRAVNYLSEEIAAHPDKYFDNAAEFIKENQAGNYGCYLGDGKIIVFASAGSISAYSNGMLKFEVPLE